MKILSEIGTDYIDEETVPFALPFPIPKLPGPNLLGVMPLWWEHSCFHGSYGRGVWGSGGHSGIYRMVFQPVQILHGFHEDSGPHWLNGNEPTFPGWFIWALYLPQSMWNLYFPYTHIPMFWEYSWYPNICWLIIFMHSDNDQVWF